ncbi:Uncharacterised protein [Corynebacterium striatum]|nr:hypothetical protein HMPREF0308_0909 [Corynebacterium striatum ATCC 6940]STD62573.1 Uncharacterised protein [Corynebacterium striatum]
MAIAILALGAWAMQSLLQTVRIALEEEEKPTFLSSTRFCIAHSLGIRRRHKKIPAKSWEPLANETT